MIHAEGLGQEFWAEAVVTAAYIRNRVVSRSTDGKSPEELWTGKKPTVRHLRVWGCEAYAHVPKEHRSKFDAKAVKCTLIGYSEGCKAWRLWDMQRRRLIVSRDVVFNENHKTVTDMITAESVQQNTVMIPDTSAKPYSAPPPPAPPAPAEEQRWVELAPAPEPAPEVPSEPVHPVQVVGSVEQPVRRSARQHRQPREWWKAPRSEQANLV